MDEVTTKFLAQVSVFSGLLPAFIALINWSSANWNQQLLRKLVFIAVCTELVSFGIARLFLINNLFISHLFNVFEFIILTLIYKRELSNIIKPKVFNFFIGAYIVYAIINSLFIETISRFNGFAKAVLALFVIFYTLAYFYKLLKEVKIKKLEAEPMFWLSTGLLIYFSASLFIFVFGNYIQPSVKLSFTFWGIHAILNISLCVFYAITLWIKPRKIV